MTIQANAAVKGKIIDDKKPKKGCYAVHSLLLVTLNAFFKLLFNAYNDYWQCKKFISKSQSFHSLMKHLSLITVITEQTFIEATLYYQLIIIYKRLTLEI